VPRSKPRKYNPDILAEGLDVIFCGVNPALSAASAGHNVSSGNNRFWQVIHLAGFTGVRLQPEDERRILEFGVGITALVLRPTRGAAEVPSHEFLQVRSKFEAKIRRYAPRSIAVLGNALFQ
jgi:double-stranded uracil-DNA glycosylase